MIEKSNIEEKLFDYFEGNLSNSEVSEVENFIQINQEFKSDFDAWKQSYLPIETFEYKHIDELLVKENSKSILFGKWKTGLAMFLISAGVSFGIYNSLHQNKQNNSSGNSINNSIKTDSNVNPDQKSKKVVLTQEENNIKISSIINTNKSIKNNINATSISESSLTTKKTKSNSETASVSNGNSNKNTNIVSKNKKQIQNSNTVTSNLNVGNTNQSINGSTLAENNSEIKNSDLNKNIRLTISIHKKAISKIENRSKPNLTKRKSKFEKYDKNILKFTNNKDPFLAIPSASPLDLNPSFAGNSKGIRLNYLYNNQWPELNDNENFLTQIVSADGYIKAIKGGVGVILMNDVMGHKKFSSQSVSFIYSPKFKLFGKTTIEPSLKYSYNKKSITWNQIKSNELIDPRNGMLDALLVNNPNEVASTVSKFSSFGTGLLLNTSKVYIGVSYDYWANPSYNLDGYSQKIDVPGKFSAQFGGSIIPIKNKDFKLSPAVIYLKLGNWDNIWFSNTFEISKFFISTSMSANKDAMFSAGYSNDYLRLSYGYGLTKPITDPIEYLSSHQLSFRFNFIPVKK